MLLDLSVIHSHHITGCQAALPRQQVTQHILRSWKLYCAAFTNYRNKLYKWSLFIYLEVPAVLSSVCFILMFKVFLTLAVHFFDGNKYLLCTQKD